MLHPVPGFSESNRNVPVASVTTVCFRLRRLLVVHQPHVVVERRGLDVEEEDACLGDGLALEVDDDAVDSAEIRPQDSGGGRDLFAKERRRLRRGGGEHRLLDGCDIPVGGLRLADDEVVVYDRPVRLALPGDGHEGEDQGGKGPEDQDENG